ncbi:MAG: hypothetical protein Q4G27_09255 [Flavobacteriaceae bacterium]|nr:hypothetical protein [Flavobacteriaceae bacterium]
MLIPLYLKAQEPVFDLTPEKLEKGKEYCDKLHWRTVMNEQTFLYCQAVYHRKNNHRQALSVIEMAGRKFPYSYHVRLQKALALQHIGSTDESTRELTGLLQLYPNKFELHNYLARIQYDKDRIKSVMPFIVSVIVEPRNPVAKENLVFIKRLLNNKNLPFELSEHADLALINTGDNNFELVSYELRSNSKGVNDRSERDYLIHRIGVLTSGLEKTSHLKRGFFWDFYGSYMAELNAHNLIDTAVDHILYQNRSGNYTQFDAINSSFRLK